MRIRNGANWRPLIPTPVGVGGSGVELVHDSGWVSMESPDRRLDSATLRLQPFRWIRLGVIRRKTTGSRQRRILLTDAQVARNTLDSTERVDCVPAYAASQQILVGLL